MLKLNSMDSVFIAITLASTGPGPYHIGQKSNKEWSDKNNIYVTKQASLTLYQLERTKAVTFTFVSHKHWVPV